jgi:hypothetical protein
MTDGSTLPSWVVGRDGQLTSFDEDRLSRALFAAGVRTGQSDPLLARELTDAALHFLADERVAEPLPVDELVELVGKVIRELGQPALARAFQQNVGSRDLPAGSGPGLAPDFAADRPGAREVLRRAAASALTEFTHREILTPDLRAAEREGLLAFFDLATPLELAAVVVPTIGTNVTALLEAARDRAGLYVAFDSPYHVLPDAAAAVAWVRDLSTAIRTVGLHAIVNLNAAEPPPTETQRGGPLFSSVVDTDTRRPAEIADVMIDALMATSPADCRVDWHVCEQDFRPANRSRLLRIARYALDGASIAFVCDHPRRPVDLAEGLDRRHPAVLGVVGVGLPRLIEVVTNGGTVLPDADVLAAKLGSLARLALSAGIARREFLRQRARPAVVGEFLLDRARLVVVPVGLTRAVDLLRELDPAAKNEVVSRQLLLGLNAALTSAKYRLAAVIDRPQFALTRPEPADVAANSNPRDQVRFAAEMHAAVGTGTADICLPDRSTPEEVADLIAGAWKQSGFVRLRFVRATRAPRQLTAGW